MIKIKEVKVSELPVVKTIKHNKAVENIIREQEQQKTLATKEAEKSQ